MNNEITISSGLTLKFHAAHDIGSGKTYAFRDAKGNGYYTVVHANNRSVYSLAQHSFVNRAGLRKALHNPRRIEGVTLTDADGSLKEIKC